MRFALSCPIRPAHSRADFGYQAVSIGSVQQLSYDSCTVHPAWDVLGTALPPAERSLVRHHFRGVCDIIPPLGTKRFDLVDALHHSPQRAKPSGRPEN
jgi:hypothetical protein